ncbi:putative fatty acyl-CoA reductase CG5065 [Aricia agestis]|uniref:putative fatty acyl-CoA reductase CG5065 n=1 Tax=Aricia agestis TaxID=91739 RepID=UPI001C207DCF|nr:putative fatty acyl-CoA reductase CG5065 [Aricia agestis]
MHSILKHVSKSCNGWITIQRLKDIRTKTENHYGVSIPEFYKGKSIFITGGTGSIGKLIIEKLLYSCPDIEKIFMLMRADSEEHAKKRIQTMITDSSFNRLNKGKVESKLVPVVGSLGSPNLGIHTRDLEKITNEASIIIHLAATLSFNEPLQQAMSYNVNGTGDVLRIAKKLKNIEALVHVSTAYCVADEENNDVEETVYKVPNVKSVIANINNTLEKCKDGNIDSDLLGGATNTYVFSKHLAESLVAEESENLPVAIVRPTMVSCCLKEPAEGFLSCVNAHSLVLYYIGNVTPILYSRRKNIQDFIPADYVCNLIIVAAANAARSKGLVVYNSASSSNNPLIFEDMTSIARSYFNKPLHPSLFFTDSKLVWYTVMYLMRVMPAYFVDTWNRILGRQSRQVRSQKNLMGALLKTNYFYRNSWIFKNENVLTLYRSLSDADKKIFPCDPSDIAWKEHLTMYIQSITKILKDKI